MQSLKQSISLIAECQVNLNGCFVIFIYETEEEKEMIDT